MRGDDITVSTERRGCADRCRHPCISPHRSTQRRHPLGRGIGSLSGTPSETANRTPYWKILKCIEALIRQDHVQRLLLVRASPMVARRLSSRTVGAVEET